MATVLQGNTSVLHGNTGASNVVYQTMPLTSGTGCISATNFVQINQFGGNSIQPQQVLQPSDQQGSSILLSLNQSTSPANSGDHFVDRSVASGGSDLLVQINGQTYRLHNVQQAQPSSPPVQVMAGNMQHSMQLNARSTTPQLLQQQLQQSQQPQQQQNPVQMMQINQLMAQQSAAQVIHTMSPGRASSPSIPLRQLAGSPQSLQQTQSAVVGQSIAMGAGQLSMQAAVRSPNQANNAPLGNQTITLTQSQLAVIQKAPQDKQLKLLQILQRQQMLRAMPGNQSVTLRPEVATNGLVVSNTTLQTSNLPAGVRLVPMTSLSQQSIAATQPTNSGSFRLAQTVLPRPVQNSVSQVPKPASAVGLQIVRPGHGIITVSQAPGTHPVSSLRTVGPDSVTHSGSRVLPRPLHSAALSTVASASGGNQFIHPGDLLLLVVFDETLALY